MLWPELRIYLQEVWFFDKFENIIHELRWENNFNLKISVTNFWRFQYFEDFDFKFVLLGQNSEWIAFC